MEYTLNIYFDNNKIKKKDLIFKVESEYIPKYKDTISIFINGIIIDFKRSKSTKSKDMLKNPKATINAQLSKALLFYYATTGKKLHIKKIELVKLYKKGDHKPTSFNEEEMHQPFIQNLKPNICFKRDDLKQIFFITKKSKAIHIALSLYLKGTSEESESAKFEFFWKAFNSLYTYMTDEKEEIKKLSNVRNFILNNENKFNDTINYIKEFDSKKIREIQWRNLILNDYNKIEKAKAYKGFILRYNDFRINQVFKEILTYRETHLKNENFLNEVNKHIVKSIKNETKINGEIISLYLIKYSYYLRNKHVHAEKLDPALHVIKTNEIEDFKEVNKIFSLFLHELIEAILKEH